MSGQPDDIRRYIRLTESSAVSQEGDTLFEGIEIPDLNAPDLVIEEIEEMVFKLRSYSENEGSPDYIRGVEEGLALAANMLERLLESHPGNSSK